MMILFCYWLLQCTADFAVVTETTATFYLLLQFYGVTMVTIYSNLYGNVGMGNSSIFDKFVIDETGLVNGVKEITDADVIADCSVFVAFEQRVTNAVWFDCDACSSLT